MSLVTAEPTIHPQAVVLPGASIGTGTTVGPFAFIGENVTIGQNCTIHNHASIQGNTTLGDNNTVYPFASLGAQTQDLKYAGGNPSLKIGNNNNFRENCSVHAATEDGDFTIIGDNNNLLAYSHVAHDCILHNNIILSNYAGMAGHITVEDYAIISPYAGVHQFSQIGQHAIVGSHSKVPQDVPPFMLIDGNPVQVRGINRVGLTRRGFSNERIEAIRELYKILYRSGFNRSQALDIIREQASDNEDYQYFLAFVERSERGLV